MSQRYFARTMRRNARRTVRRAYAQGSGGRSGGRGRTGSQAIFWWLAIVVGVILLAGVIGAVQDRLSSEPASEEPTAAVSAAG